jgi:hypothetical protein
MLRRTVFVVFAGLAGCVRATKPFEKVLPEQIEGKWRRNELGSIAEVPELVSQLGFEEGVQTTYKGSGVVHVRAFRMRAETSAFELMQKWRPNEGIAAYKGPFFFVAIPQGTDPQAVAGLLRALQQAAS